MQLVSHTRLAFPNYLAEILRKILLKIQTGRISAQNLLRQSIKHVDYCHLTNQVQAIGQVFKRIRYFLNNMFLNLLLILFK